MIRWYDYIAAFLAADLMLTIAFTLPYIGFVAAYAVYEFGWEFYCEFRKAQELDTNQTTYLGYINTMFAFYIDILYSYYILERVVTDKNRVMEHARPNNSDTIRQS